MKLNRLWCFLWMIPSGNFAETIKDDIIIVVPNDIDSNARKVGNGH
jgi:hypothetical protein